VVLPLAMMLKLMSMWLWSLTKMYYRWASLASVAWGCGDESAGDAVRPNLNLN
jgi:hypothetical protein